MICVVVMITQRSGFGASAQRLQKLAQERAGLQQSDLTVDNVLDDIAHEALKPPFSRGRQLAKGLDERCQSIFRPGLRFHHASSAAKPNRP